jgi:erythromycin 3''-O-methyltransferase
MSWTKENRRHAARMLWRGRNPAATVYDSLGPDFFLALAPGWLNLGLWDGAGDVIEAPAAVQRLVETLAAELPRDGVILDVGNGLGKQEPVIAACVRPRRLVALNVTESQLRAGRSDVRRAQALPVVGDATRLPIASGTCDGIISVEAAFHFSSRARFFAEARRVLKAGGVLSFSDVSAEGLPRRPAEVIAGLVTIRFWQLSLAGVMSARRIGAALTQAGFTDVRVDRCGGRVIDPAIRAVSQRLEGGSGAPASQRAAARLMLAQWALLRRRGLMDYLLVRATAA